ncbi:MAG: LptA/OstA family protein [Elusimicrobiota bacterium]|nr:hypothetical protein [Endomicrobiia bacterium]MDW8164988.1 LptA/OstA family protein [Elusimicrobiota bacterium]
MSLVRSSFVIFIFVLLNNNLFCEKVIRKIEADVTEYDRKTNSTNFYGNVKIDITNGYIFCDKALYKEKENKIICEKNVYFVYKSTSEIAEIKVKSSYLEYNIKNQSAEFKNDIYVVCRSTLYVSDYDFSNVDIRCGIINLYNNDKTMIFKENVVISTKDSNIFCDIAEYKYGENLLNVNSVEEKRIKFISLTDKLKMKSCQANLAIVDFKKEIIILKGKVELIF